MKMPEAIAIECHDFNDAETLAQALARDVADVLRAAIVERGHGLIALSGGNTPRRFLQLLAQHVLDWSRVTVTLTDERWVPAQDSRSNEHLLRETLLQGASANARFEPLYVAAATPEAGYATIVANVAKLPFPFDAVVLGMGTDGHCASLFPDGDRLDDALRPESPEQVMPMRAVSAGEPRMTLTLAALVNTRAMYLLFEGAEKERVFECIQAGDPGFVQAPVRNVLQRSPVMPKLYRCG